MITPQSKIDFKWSTLITTRWHDNDIYGHVNNVTYYSFFDTAVNRYLIEVGGLDIHKGEAIAFVVKSQCEYKQPVAYPQNITIGLAVSHLGNTSVTYCLGVFVEGQDEMIAKGEFVHVFVNRESGKSTPIPAKIREALGVLVV